MKPRDPTPALDCGGGHCVILQAQLNRGTFVCPTFGELTTLNEEDFGRLAGLQCACGATLTAPKPATVRTQYLVDEQQV